MSGWACGCRMCKATLYVEGWELVACGVEGGELVAYASKVEC